MKAIQTAVSTGSIVKTMFNDDKELIGTIGVLKQGKIAIHWKLSQTSGFTEYVTVRALNSRIKTNNITIPTPIN